MAQSAFAARRAAAKLNSLIQPTAPATNANNDFEDVSGENSVKHGDHLPRKKRRKLDKGSSVVPKTKVTSLEDDLASRASNEILAKHSAMQQQSLAKARDSETIGSSTSRIVPEIHTQEIQPERQLDSDYTLTWNDAYDIVNIELAAGNSLAVVGEYDLWLKKGSINILGATIHASPATFRVHAPTSHAIPTIKALLNPYGPTEQVSEFTLRSCRSGLRQLQRLEPRFAQVWGGSTSLASFSIQESFHHPLLNISKEWTGEISRISDGDELPVVMICGPKNAGKSSFAKYLSNSLLSRRFADTGVAYLDLDPGQPEYTTPANLSLSHVLGFNLGPAFTHPGSIHSPAVSILRQHQIGRFSPREDSGHYLRCASDLYQHYQKTLGRNRVPLVINTCGWVQGLGTELLLSLLTITKPTRVICFTSSETDETELALKEALSSQRVDLRRLPSEFTVSGPRSGADLRAMQSCSYFHLDEPENAKCNWNTNVLLKSAKLSLEYAGEDPILSGILITGDRINYDMLEDAIEKTVLSLVAIEDQSAISHALSQASNDAIIVPDDKDHGSSQEEGYNDPGVDSTGRSPLEYTLKTNLHGIPYLSTAAGTNPPLSPTTSRSLGEVLLNAIDINRKSIEVHTPIPIEEMKSCLEQGQSLILVRGYVGMPEWSYLEEYHQAKAAEEDISALRELDPKSDLAQGFETLDISAWAGRTPYVDFQDNQGKRSRNKVRRVRRNLGTGK